MELVFAIDDLRDTIEHDALARDETVAYVEAVRSLLFFAVRPDPAEPDSSTLHRLETLGARIEAVRHRIGHEAAQTLLYYLTNAFRHRSRLHAMILRRTSKETRRMYSSYHEELKAGAIAIMQEQILDEIREESRNEARIEARLDTSIDLLVQLVDKRGLLDHGTRKRIEHCRDQAQLQQWFDRAITATTAAAIFDAA